VGTFYNLTIHIHHLMNSKDNIHIWRIWIFFCFLVTFLTYRLSVLSCKTLNAPHMSHLYISILLALYYNYADLMCCFIRRMSRWTRHGRCNIMYHFQTETLSKFLLPRRLIYQWDWPGGCTWSCVHVGVSESVKQGTQLKVSTEDCDRGRFAYVCCWHQFLLAQ